MKNKETKAIAVVDLHGPNGHHSEPVLLSDSPATVVDLGAVTVTVTLFGGLVNCEPGWSMAGFEPRSVEDPCPKCQSSMDRIDAAFNYRFDTYPAVVCDRCKMLYFDSASNYLDKLEVPKKDWTMPSITPKLLGDPCPQCGSAMERKQNVFAINEIPRPAIFCDACKVFFFEADGPAFDMQQTINGLHMMSELDSAKDS